MFARVARDLAEQVRAGCRETMRERGSKGAGADGVCPCTMYDVRCTIAMFARVARRSEANADGMS